MLPTIRLARPVTDIPRTTEMYTRAFDLEVLGSFEDHAGFDGVMLGRKGAGFHFEFTHCHFQKITPQPTEEDLIVFYLPDKTEWERARARAVENGFVVAKSFNEYWDRVGQTFVDADGYRVVLQNAAWTT